MSSLQGLPDHLLTSLPIPQAVHRADKVLSAQAPCQSVTSKRKQAVIPAAALRPSLPSLVPLAGDRHRPAPVFLCQQAQPVRKLLVTVVDDAGVEQHSS